jgi:sorting nexin-25
VELLRGQHSLHASFCSDLFCGYRKLRESVNTYVDESHIMGYLRMFRDTLWPGGQFRGSSIPRTSDEKKRTREEANHKLSTLIPGEDRVYLEILRKLKSNLDLAANMIGRSNARRGARRIFAVLQNRRLNQHIVYAVLDEVCGYS